MWKQLVTVARPLGYSICDSVFDVIVSVIERRTIVTHCVWLQNVNSDSEGKYSMEDYMQKVTAQTCEMHTFGGDQMRINVYYDGL